MKKILICLLLYTTFGFSQTNDINDMQFGVAFKLVIDLNNFSNFGKYSNYNASLFGGMGLICLM